MAIRSFTDMMGNKVDIHYPPRRIVSLVPSQTELLYDLGLDAEVAGITKFCVHPQEWFRNKKRVGGTKTVHLDIIDSLQPDLVIANKEENTKEQVAAIAERYPTWVSNIQTIAEGLQMIREVALITGKAEQGAQLAAEISDGFAKLQQKTAKPPYKPKRVAYFIWRKPWMCAGGDTFISDMIKQAGWVNVLADQQRYPEVVLEDLAGKQVDLVLLSSEPYPFKDVHIAEIKSILPNAEVMLADGEMFSWYGSRMKKSVKYLTSLLELPN